MSSFSTKYGENITNELSLKLNSYYCVKNFVLVDLCLVLVDLRLSLFSQSTSFSVGPLESDEKTTKRIVGCLHCTMEHRNRMQNSTFSLF